MTKRCRRTIDPPNLLEGRIGRMVRPIVKRVAMENQRLSDSVSSEPHPQPAPRKYEKVSGPLTLRKHRRGEENKDEEACRPTNTGVPTNRNGRQYGDPSGQYQKQNANGSASSLIVVPRS